MLLVGAIAAVKARASDCDRTKKPVLDAALH